MSTEEMQKIAARHTFGATSKWFHRAKFFNQGDVQNVCCRLRLSSSFQREEYSSSLRHLLCCEDVNQNSSINFAPKFSLYSIAAFRLCSLSRFGSSGQFVDSSGRAMDLRKFCHSYLWLFTLNF